LAGRSAISPKGALEAPFVSRGVPSPSEKLIDRFPNKVVCFKNYATARGGDSEQPLPANSYSDFGELVAGPAS